MVYVYFYTEFNNTKQEHAFLVKLRKENKKYFYFIISGINPTTNLIEYAISINENSFTNFTPLNQSNTNNSFSIDTELGSYNIVFLKIRPSTSYYYLFKYYKNDPNSNWNYKDLDNTNSYSYSLPILAINSSLGLANYLFVNTSTNTVNVENLNTQYLAYAINGFGNFGDIKVDNDLNFYIAINTKRGITNGNDLLIKRNTTWQASIRLPNNTFPINYFLNSIRLESF
jgi:hypothetical protein